MCIFLYHEKQHNGTFSKFQTAAHLKKNFIFKVTKEHRCTNKLEFNKKKETLQNYLTKTVCKKKKALNNRYRYRVKSAHEDQDTEADTYWL